MSLSYVIYYTGVAAPHLKLCLPTNLSPLEIYQAVTPLLFLSEAATLIPLLNPLAAHEETTDGIKPSVVGQLAGRNVRQCQPGQAL